MNKTITFRTTATITTSDTITNDEYFKKWSETWDAASESDRQLSLSQMMADSLPKPASNCTVEITGKQHIVLKDGTTSTYLLVVQMTAAELVANGVFY